MLKGLDQVEWGKLESAYRSATDFPELLRNLLVSDPEVRKSALSNLMGSVTHQAT